MTSTRDNGSVSINWRSDSNFFAVCFLFFCISTTIAMIALACPMAIKSKIIFISIFVLLAIIHRQIGISRIPSFKTANISGTVVVKTKRNKKTYSVNMVIVDDEPVIPYFSSYYNTPLARGFLGLAFRFFGINLFHQKLMISVENTYKEKIIDKRISQELLNKIYNLAEIRFNEILANHC